MTRSYVTRVELATGAKRGLLDKGCGRGGRRVGREGPLMAGSHSAAHETTRTWVERLARKRPSSLLFCALYVGHSDWLIAPVCAHACAPVCGRRSCLKMSKRAGARECERNPYTEHFVRGNKGIEEEKGLPTVASSFLGTNFNRT
jgi:hypothetical protein